MWLTITEIERDIQFMLNVLEILQKFYIHNILPEVLIRMDCDSAKCKWEWFHLSCVNLRRVPIIGIVQFVVKSKEKRKMAETCDVKNKKRKT